MGYKKLTRSSHNGLTMIATMARYMNMTDHTAKLILDLGAKVGASAHARSKWPVRGVSYRWRIKIIQAAALAGKQLTEADFEADAMAKARAA